MNEILAGCDKSACIIDDVCVATDSDISDVESHEKFLFPVLQKLQDAGVTLNMEKCEFLKPEITFVGHKINAQGISADEKKVTAIQQMPTPKCVTDLRRFMGMVNQLGKFSNKLADITVPLRPLLSIKNDWVWGQEQDRAFQSVKDEICSPTVLAQYNPSFETKIRADSSKDGYGAVLLQRKSADDDFRPVYFASKALSPTEQRYSIIEKEAGAIVFACQKFD